MERHKFDILSFAFGALYTLIGLVFLIPATAFDLGPVLANSLRWVWPIAIVGIGAAIVVPLALTARDRGSVEED